MRLLESLSATARFLARLAFYILGTLAIGAVVYVLLRAIGYTLSFIR